MENSIIGGGGGQQGSFSTLKNFFGFQPTLKMLQQNLASEGAKKVFFGIFNGENTVFTKSAQRMV